MPDRESRINFDHSPCYRQGLHAPTKSGRQWCRTNGPASRVGGNPQSAAAPPRDDTVAAQIRERCAAAARRYQPDRIRLLLVAQARPEADDRYFYFPDVVQHDWLFRAVVGVLLPDAELTRDNKPLLLAQLRDRGVFLIDLKPDPIVNSRASLSELRPHVPALLHRIAELEPERIILIKTDVYDAAYPALAAGALPVSKVRIPFPSSGRQAEFKVAFARALAGE
ncbi:hypothetical protein [Mycobacteroides chelonae]|uniref:hypothetical protein n=1 Tax=Mycobacteroides chelonae TaxID=1774 RepID=UPI000B03DC6C|nr:hypothetical protein [Mycobacteroides chelonae]